MGVAGTEIRLRIDTWTGTIDRAGYEWTRRRAADLVRRGDLVDARIQKVSATARTFTAALDQLPELEGAVVAIDNRTGQILAMAGGANFERSTSR